MKEPSVTLTDYLLTLECLLFAWLLSGYGDVPSVLQISFVGLFVALASAAFCGGTVHGFFPDESTLGYRMMWPCTLISIGVAAYFAWAIGASLLFESVIVYWIMTAAAILLAAYCWFVVMRSRGFLVAIIHYMPAVLFSLVAFIILSFRTGSTAAILGTVGLIGTILAAVIQARRIALHEKYFDHNALYHVIQAAALVLIFLAARLMIMS